MRRILGQTYNKLDQRSGVGGVFRSLVLHQVDGVGGLRSSCCLGSFYGHIRTRGYMEELVLLLARATPLPFKDGLVPETRRTWECNLRLMETIAGDPPSHPGTARPHPG